MKDHYLQYISLLEKTLASFYADIKDHQSYSAIKSVLEFMETHSEGHAAVVEEAIAAHPLPHLDTQEIVDYQNQLTHNSRTAIEHDNTMDILDDLAYTEEALGDFYKKIAGEVKDLSKHLALISEIISSLGDDEYNHRDILLDNKEKLKGKE